MLQFEDIKGKRIALLIWNVEKENDACIYWGEIIQQDKDLLFIKQRENRRIILSDDILARFKPVEGDELKQIFKDADFAVQLFMASLPNDAEGYTPAGMQWPSQ